VLPVQLDIPVAVGNQDIREEDIQEILDDRATSFTQLMQNHSDAKDTDSKGI